MYKMAVVVVKSSGRVRERERMNERRRGRVINHMSI